jgi:hypothetical protein
VVVAEEVCSEKRRLAATAYSGGGSSSVPGQSTSDTSANQRSAAALPQEVVEQATPFLKAGVDDLIVELPDAHNLEHVQAAAEALALLR